MKDTSTKKPTFYRTTLNSIKAQSRSSHHFSKRESYHFLGFSVQLSTPCCQHSTYRSLALSLCSSSPFPSPHLLCCSPGRAERTRCPYRRRENGQYTISVVLTFPLLRDGTSSFPVQVTWRVFKNRCSEIWGEQKPKEFRFPLLAPPDAVDTKVSIWEGEGGGIVREHQRQETGRWGSLCLDVAPLPCSPLGWRGNKMEPRREGER